jgi:hypothetical protein
VCYTPLDVAQPRVLLYARKQLRMHILMAFSALAAVAGCSPPRVLLAMVVRPSVEVASEGDQTGTLGETRLKLFQSVPLERTLTRYAVLDCAVGVTGGDVQPRGPVRAGEFVRRGDFHLLRRERGQDAVRAGAGHAAGVPWPLRALRRTEQRAEGGRGA